jgi:hypothetical protein
MRRATQNLGLDALPAPILSGDGCKGFAAMACLKADDNGLNFLTGVSIPKKYDNNDIHLSFGDKFGTVIFLYALHEETTLVPAQLLCLDHDAFMRFAFPQESSNPVPPTTNEWARFNTDEFLEANKKTDQESVIKDTVVFRTVASRFIKHLGQMKNKSEYHDIFYPQKRQSSGACSTMADTGDNMIDCNPHHFGDDMTVEVSTTNEGNKSKKKSSAKGKRSLQEINLAYDAHVTPRKRTATVRYNVKHELPKIPRSVPKIIIDMNALDEEVDREVEAESKSNKKGGKKQNAKKAAKKKGDKKAKAKISEVNLSAYTHQNVDPITPTNPSLQTTIPGKKLAEKNDERDYLRQQSIQDLDLETRRANQAFDMAERANRMA